MNITLDDTSPQIRYYSTNRSRAWQRDNSGDPGHVAYYGQTFAGTTGEGDRMVLTFNGSAIWVYGSKWFNHGAYSVQLDDHDLVRKTGTSQDRVFQSVLHYEGDLDTAKEHTITLTNLSSASRPPAEYWLDIDYIVIQKPLRESAKVSTLELDDSSPAIQYTGKAQWEARYPTSPDFHNLTLHVTNTVGNAATLSFNGSSVQVFGSMTNDHGNYSVTLDGVDKGTYNGSWPKLTPGISLFMASGLSPGPHSLTITDNGGPQGNFFDIDRIIVNTTIDPLANSSPSSDSESSSPGVSIGPIVGGVVGGVVVLALIGLLVWWIRRKKRRSGDRMVEGPIDLTGDEVKPYRDSSPGLAVEGLYTAGGGSYVTTGYTIDHASLPDEDESHTRSAPYLTIPPPPRSDTSSYPRSAGPASSTFGHQTLASPIDRERRYDNPFREDFSEPTSHARSTSDQSFPLRDASSVLPSQITSPRTSIRANAEERSEMGPGQLSPTASAATTMTTPTVAHARDWKSSLGYAELMTSERGEGVGEAGVSREGDGLFRSATVRGPDGELEPSPPAYEQATDARR